VLIGFNNLFVSNAPLCRLLHRLCELCSTLTTGSQSLACGYLSDACCKGWLRVGEFTNYLLQHRQRLTLLIEIQTDDPLPKRVFVSLKGDKMMCLVCKHNRFKKGTTVLPIERGKAILLITDIPVRVCENCGETFTDEETAQDVQDLANDKLSGEINYAKSHGKREVLVTAFS
jgi:YgiT-type zinc finger domain-containing protein